MVEAIIGIRRIVVSLLVLYLLLTAGAYLFQDRMIFFRPGISPERILRIRRNYPEAEEIALKTPDGITLRGWLLHADPESFGPANGPGFSDGPPQADSRQEDPPHRRPSPVLIYFGGNAEEVSGLIDMKELFRGWSLLLVNYRGYGHSEGNPGETELLGDAVFLYDTMTAREDIDGDRTAVFGRSLGTAPAIHLSAERKIAGTVLVSPFGSMVEIARSHYPWLPVSLFLKHRFEVLPRAASAPNPMLTLAASGDTIIPLAHSEQLFEAWKGEKQLKIIDGAGHNDISLYEDFWPEIAEFLDRVERNL